MGSIVCLRTQSHRVEVIAGTVRNSQETTFGHHFTTPLMSEPIQMDTFTYHSYAETQHAGYGIEI